MSVLESNLYAQRSITPLDSLQIFKLIDSAEVFFDAENYDTAILFCNRAEQLSHRLNYKRGEAFALIESTDIFIDKDELDQAGTTAASTLKIGNQLNDSLISAISWMQLAQIKMYQDQFDAAIPLFETSLQLYFSHHHNRYAALAYNDLGYTWGRRGNLSKQAEYLLMSIYIYEKYYPEKYGELGIAYNNLSTVYYGLNDRSKAIEYAIKSLAFKEKKGDIAKLSIGCCNICQFYTGVDSSQAEKYLKLCIQYAIQSKQDARIIHSYTAATNFYNTIDRYAEALDYELKAVAMLEKDGKNQPMLARRYMAIGTLYRELKSDTSLINQYYNKSFSLLQSIPDRESLRDYYFQITDNAVENKNYFAAYRNYKKYILYRDSILSDKTAASIAEIATKYETNKKDNEIIRLNSQQGIKQLEIEKQHAIISGNEALAHQRQIAIDLLVKSQELRDVTISRQQMDLEKQMLLAKTSEQQLEIQAAQNNLQDKQLSNQKNVKNFLIASFIFTLVLGFTFFNRYQLKKKLEQQNNLLAMRHDISQDLHDDIGASLSNINILNELAIRNIQKPQKSTEYLSKASDDIQRISESLSDIVWNINPKYDDLQNLLIRMKRYAADMLEGKDIEGQYEFPDESEDLNLNITQRRNFYLIFKEAINNLIKYSYARHAVIKVTADKHHFGFRIQDNGKGFDRKSIKFGNGLSNMEERAQASGAIVSIHSSPGEGTTIELEFKSI